MVSTRGPKYKFSQGERVLCYEPDPTKAKVLYDSKVIDVVEQKGKRGRRTVQYLIHFKGWNSSWDRCVGEELVLKDTEHNRQLQRTLAESAQLQIGTYLYRKERKKGGSGSSAPGNTTTAGKRPRVSDCEDEDVNTFSSQEEGDVEEEQSEDISQTNSRSSTGGNSSSCEESDSSSEYNSDEYGSASVHVGPALKELLNQDYELVVCGGRLLRLPCRPNALQVLEGCVKHHTEKTIAEHTPLPPQADIQEQVRRLNILREVADGLRVYLDFILRDQLLYENEREQFFQALADGILKDTQLVDIKQEEDSNTSKTFPEDYAHLPPSPCLNSQNVKIKSEPVSPSRTTSETESHYKMSPSSNEQNNKIPSDWQSIDIKEEDTKIKILSRATSNQVNASYVNSNSAFQSQDVRKHINDEAAKCSDPHETIRNRESPIHRYNMRETRSSSCNSEAIVDVHQDKKINSNGQCSSDIGSTVSSHDGNQLDMKINSEECQISNNVLVKDGVKTNNVIGEHENQQSIIQGLVSNSKVNVISSESGRVLRGCVKKLEKSVMDNGNSTNVSRNRRAKRPRLSSRRLRSHRRRSRTINTPALLPAPAPASTPLLSMPNSQPEESNSQTELSDNQLKPQPEQIEPVSSQPGTSKTLDDPPIVPKIEINNGINDEFKEALEWRIVPPDYPPFPAAIYGAVHLARLFVKLPEYLSVINMPESKLELIVEFVEYFVKYLEEHAEWFGESFYYIPDTSDS